MLSSTVLAVLKLWPVAAQAALFDPEKERRNPAVHSLVLDESTMAAPAVFQSLVTVCSFLWDTVPCELQSPWAS